MIHDIKVLQTNLENSQVPIAKIAMTSRLDKMNNELKIFCESFKSLTPRTQVMDIADPANERVDGDEEPRNQAMDSAGYVNEGSDGDDEMQAQLSQGQALPLLQTISFTDNHFESEPLRDDRNQGKELSKRVTSK